MDVYMYQADLHCVDCGIAIKHKLHKAGNFPADIPNESSFDSDDYPKGLYPNGGGDADCPNHCGTCGVFLENPLTEDGQEYVKQALKDNDGDSDVLQEWSDFYDYLKEEEKKTLFEEVEEMEIPFSNHYSDLYIPVTPETTELLRTRYGAKSVHYGTFINQVEGGLWYDCPFKYTPFWDKKFGSK